MQIPEEIQQSNRLKCAIFNYDNPNNEHLIHCPHYLPPHFYPHINLFIPETCINIPMDYIRFIVLIN